MVKRRIVKKRKTRKRSQRGGGLFGDIVNGAKGLFGMKNTQPVAQPVPQTEPVLPVEEEEETDEIMRTPASHNLGAVKGGRRRKSRRKRRKSRKSRRSKKSRKNRRSKKRRRSRRKRRR